MDPLGKIRKVLLIGGWTWLAFIWGAQADWGVGADGGPAGVACGLSALVAGFALLDLILECKE